MEDKTQPLALTSSIDGGLTQEEASRRLGEYGPNEVPEKKTSPILSLAGKFWGFTPARAHVRSAQTKLFAVD